MKKQLVILMLVLTGMTRDLFAQEPTIYTSAPTMFNAGMNVNPPNWLRHRFIITSKNGNNIAVLVPDKPVFDEIIDLESIIRNANKNLSHFVDSLKDEITSKRIQHLDDNSGNIKIRIHESQPITNNFVLLPDGPAILKIQQETLEINRRRPISQESGAKAEYDSKSYMVIVSINDINKLNSMLDGSINAAMLEIKKEWDGLKRWSAKDNWKTTLSGTKNLIDPSKSRSLREPYISEKVTFSIFVQVGLQTVNNTLLTSAAAGFQLTNRIKPASEYKYQLMWEPYFVFDKNPDGKFKMRRNDFLTFQHQLQVVTLRPNNQRIEFTQLFNVGYLIHRSGNFFNKNTFKFGLPGARFKFLQLHPEFMFNDLFKNFQPGLKLFLDLD